MPLDATDNERLEVSGDLTLDNVARLYQDSRKLLPGKVRTVDLGSVSRIDSAGLALLLEWQSAARQRGAELSFSGAPDDLLRLAALCDSTALLGLTARGAEAG
jgi:phospholipid transport system transporter-binding protein